MQQLSLPITLSLEELLDFGCVYISSERIKKPDYVITPQQVLEIYLSPKRYLKPFDLSERILEKNNNFLIVHKPGAVPCHPTIDNEKENLLFWYSELLGEKLGLPHRLDQGTEGLLILTRNQDSLSTFTKMFAEKLIEKKYLALVEGRWEKLGLITHFMKPDARAPKILSVTDPGGWKPCALAVEQVDVWENFSVLDIKLITGRTHQIRTQLAFEGYPIRGDNLYGSSGLPSNGFDLCCYKLAFTFPGNPDQQTFSLWNT
ncbi:MAG: RNA pseudouridine synthase [Bdellovibrionota bacterium]